MPLLGRQKGYLKAAKHLEARERWDRPNSQSGLASNHLAAAIHNIRFSYRTSFRLAYCEGRGKERGKKKRKGKKGKRRRIFTVVISLLQPINSSGNFRGRCTFFIFLYPFSLPPFTFQFPSVPISFILSCPFPCFPFRTLFVFIFSLFFPFFSGRGGYWHYYTYSIYIYVFFPLRIVL